MRGSENARKSNPDRVASGIEPLGEVNAQKTQQPIDRDPEFVMKLVHVLRREGQSGQPAVGYPCPTVSTIDDETDVAPDKRLPTEVFERKRSEVMFPEHTQIMLAFVRIRV